MQILVDQLTQLAQQTGNDGLLLDPTQYDTVSAQLQVKQSIDRNLELDLKDVDTQHQEVQTEVDAVKKVIDKNIDMTFKTFA